MRKKRILSIIMILLLIIGVNMTYDSPKASGASVTIALSSSSVSVGGSVTATVTVSGSDVSQYDIYVTYDSSVLQFNSGSGAASVNGSGGTIRLVGGTGSTSLNFTAIANGSCYISTSGTEVYNINYEQIAITHAGANVTVATTQTTESQSTTEESDSTAETEDSTTESDERSSNCDLKSLLVSPGTLDPEFSADTTSYFVQLDEDATSIVVSAQASDDKASVSVSGADELEKGENNVSVTVTAENGAVKVYKLRVAVGDILEEAEVTIDGKTYKFVNDATDIEVPELFSATTITYDEWDIMAYESPNKKIVIVCLEDEDYELSWFVYDGESFYPYCEYSASYNRYVIIPVPAGVPVPDGFTETELTIGTNEVTAYQNADEWAGDIYLIYAMNLSGSEGFYLYDSGEGTFMRYLAADENTDLATDADVSVATATDSDANDGGFFSDEKLIYIIIGALALGLLCFLCLTIVFAAKRRKTAAQLEQAEDMIEHLTSGNVAFASAETENNADNADGDVPADTENTENNTEKADGDTETADNVENAENTENTDDAESAQTPNEGDRLATIEFTPIRPSRKESDKPDESDNPDEADKPGESDKPDEADKSEKKQAYEEFEKQSAIINDRINSDYDATADSAFADDSAADTEASSGEDDENAQKGQ